MRVTTRVKITNDKLPGLSARLRQGAAALVADVAEQTAERARQNIISNGSVRTGALLNGVRVESTGELAAEVVSEREGGDATVPVFVEYGTVRAPAKPYFRPALESVRPEFYAGAGEVVDAAASGKARIRRSPGPAGGAGFVTQLRRSVRKGQRIARDAEREANKLSEDEQPKRR